MGTGPLAHPFRFAANGTVLTRVAGSEDDVNDRLRLIVETVQDERALFPSYGIPDPAFIGVSAGDVQACLSEYGPENVQIGDFEMEAVDAQISNVHIQWEFEESEDDDSGEFDGMNDDDYDDDDEDEE